MDLVFDEEVRCYESPVNRMHGCGYRGTATQRLGVGGVFRCTIIWCAVQAADRLVGSYQCPQPFLAGSKRNFSEFRIVFSHGGLPADSRGIITCPGFESPTATELKPQTLRSVRAKLERPGSNDALR